MFIYFSSIDHTVVGVIFCLTVLQGCLLLIGLVVFFSHILREFFLHLTPWELPFDVMGDKSDD